LSSEGYKDVKVQEFKETQLTHSERCFFVVFVENESWWKPQKFNVRVVAHGYVLTYLELQDPLFLTEGTRSSLTRKILSIEFFYDPTDNQWPGPHVCFVVRQNGGIPEMPNEKTIRIRAFCNGILDKFWVWLLFMRDTHYLNLPFKRNIDVPETVLVCLPVPGDIEM
jgi:hypothetical protein